MSAPWSPITPWALCHTHSPASSPLVVTGTLRFTCRPDSRINNSFRHSAEASSRAGRRHTCTQHAITTSSFRSRPTPVRCNHPSTSHPALFNSLNVLSIRQR